MAFKSIIGVAILALLAPYLYERGHASIVFWKHAPHRLVKVNTFASHEIRFSDRIRSCEDALLVESKGIAILGCDPGRERWNTVMGIFLPEPVESGRLYTFDYKNAGASDAEALTQLEFVDFAFESDFHTLGMAYGEASSTLFVASHRHDSPAIEMFKLDLEASTATHLRSIQHPLIRGPNSIALLGDHELYVTNSNHFLVRENPILHKLEVNLGLPGGTVVHVDFAPVDPEAPAAAGEEVQASVVARVPFANGIELLNGSTIAAVASSAGAKVHFFTIDNPPSSSSTSSPSSSSSEKTTPKFTRAWELRVPFAPDNLSVSKDGALVIAGHPHIPTLGKFAATRHVCNSAEGSAGADVDVDERTREMCETLAAPSWVSRWTPEEGLRTLYADVEYPSSATGLRDSERKVGVISGLYAKGILVWRE